MCRISRQKYQFSGSEYDQAFPNKSPNCLLSTYAPLVQAVVLIQGAK